MGRQTFDKERIHVNLAKLKLHGYEFEIVIDPDLAMKYKNGQLDDVRTVLKSEQVFHDAKKGDVASENIMKQAFNTDNTLEVAKKILNDGEIQLTSEYREKFRANLTKQIIDIIHRNSVDPSGNPHPITRIENALKEAKVHVDEHKKAEDQVQDIVKKLRPILPLKFEVKEVEIHLKAEHAAKLYGTVQKFGKLIKDEWLNDGSWLGVLEIPGGLETDLYDQLNNATKGEVETKVIKTR